tara:strand:- start:380 stop:955 length:576 start_codon:yes stop_codon:yes gene_type:complete
MATLQERIDRLAGEMQGSGAMSDVEARMIKDTLAGEKQRNRAMLPSGAMSDKDTEIITNALKPNTIEENIAAIQQQMDDAIKVSPERQQFIQARQELIDEVLMPLSDSGYSDIVNIILTKPKDSLEHDQASIALAEIMAQVDEDFDPEEFDMMINMVSREPRPADLINPEGLPDSPPTPPRPMPMGIGGLK